MISQKTQSNIEKSVMSSLELCMQEDHPDREYRCSQEGSFFDDKSSPCAMLTLAGFDFTFSLLSRFYLEFFRDLQEGVANAERMKEKVYSSEYLLDLTNRFSSGFKRSVEHITPYVGMSTPKRIQNISRDAFVKSKYNFCANASIYIDDISVMSGAAFLYAGDDFAMDDISATSISTPSEDDTDDDFFVF